MPFSAKQGFFFQASAGPAPGIAWYDYNTSTIYNEVSTWTASSNATFTESTIGVTFDNLEYRSACLHTNGNIYFAPRDGNNGVIEFDPTSNTSQKVTWGDIATLPTSVSKFHGITMGENGNLYCIPFSVSEILEIDPINQTATSSAFGATISGSIQYSGGIMGSDGKIYCPPQNAQNILIIDTTTSPVTATTQNYGLFTTGSNKWIGGCRGMSDDKIYFSPYQSGNVLVIEPSSNTAVTSTFGTTWTTGGAHQGCASDADGKIYFGNHNAGSHKVLDPSSNTVNTVGGATGTKCIGVHTGADGNIYMSPFTVSTVQKIDVTSGANGTTINVGTPTNNRYFGGALGLDGIYYGCPDAGSDDVLKVNSYGSGTATANAILSPYVNKGSH